MSSPPASLLAQALEQFAEHVALRIVELQRAEPACSPAGEQGSPWLGVEKAAAYLDWPKQRLYKLTASGAIPHYKQEGRLLFNRAELDRWLVQYTQGSERAGC